MQKNTTHCIYMMLHNITRYHKGVLVLVSGQWDYQQHGKVDNTEHTHTNTLALKWIAEIHPCSS